MEIPAKAIYVDGRQIGFARTWDEVAARLLQATDREFSGYELSRMHSEGPGGFFLDFASRKVFALGM